MQMPEEGQLTQVIYRHIKDQEWDDAIEILKFQLQCVPGSQAATSLLAYSYYHKGEYASSVPLYEELSKKFPESERYAMALANCRFKAQKPADALQLKLDGKDADVMRAYCKHDMDDVTALTNLVEKLTKNPTDDHRIFCLKGNLLARQLKYREAIECYDAANDISPDPRIHFAKALAYYRENNYPQCLKTLGDLVDLAAKKYPDLVQAAQTFSQNQQQGMAPEDAATTAVQNINVLLASSLVEAFNLKAAIEWNLGDEYAANRALNSMPYRKEEDLDAITLHNKALSELQHDPSTGVKKLQFLIQQPPFPVEAFQNLINIYIQHELLDLAADLIAENDVLAKSSLEPEKLAFYQAVVQSVSSPEEAYSQLDKLKTRYAAYLRKIRQEITTTRQKGTAKVDEASHGRFNTSNVKGMSKDEISVNTLLQQYEQKLSIFIPVVTWQTSILYNLQRYRGAFKILTQFEDLLDEHPSYKINQANILFSNEAYQEAMEKYQQVVDQLGADNILDVPAIAVANLCTCQVLTSQNSLAENVMQRVDKAQQDFLRDAPGSEAQLLHLSIINIVLGTLYVINANMSFGIRRIIAAMEPINEKLSADSWMYVKRPLISLAEQSAMQVGGPMEEQLIDQVIVFLDDIIKNGSTMSTIAAQVSFEATNQVFVAEEARALKAIFLQLM